MYWKYLIQIDRWVRLFSCCFLWGYRCRWFWCITSSVRWAGAVNKLWEWIRSNRTTFKNCSTSKIQKPHSGSETILPRTIRTKSTHKSSQSVIKNSKILKKMTIWWGKSPAEGSLRFERSIDSSKVNFWPI